MAPLPPYRALPLPLLIIGIGIGVNNSWGPPNPSYNSHPAGLGGDSSGGRSGSAAPTSGDPPPGPLIRPDPGERVINIR